MMFTHDQMFYDGHIHTTVTALPQSCLPQKCHSVLILIITHLPNLSSNYPFLFSSTHSQTIPIPCCRSYSIPLLYVMWRTQIATNGQREGWVYIFAMSESSEATENAFRELISNIKAGSLTAVEAILQNGAALLVNKIESQFRQPPLYFAALATGDDLSAEMIKLLLRYGASAKFKDHNEQTILFYICREGKQKCAEIVLAHGLSLDQVDVYGQTAMFYAVSENRLQLVRKYATKERVNHVDKLVAQTPLYYAARRGHLEMSRLLIERGANVVHLDQHGKTAVQYARRAKFLETADYLNSQLKRVKEGRSVTGQEKRRQEGREPRQTYKLVLVNEKGQSHELTEEEAGRLLEEYPNLKELLDNPDSISKQQLASTEGETWEKAALRVLTSCSKLKGSYYFLQPVDPIRFNILDYFTIIKRPMDLGTVKKRLLHNCYPRPQSFIQEMQLIWNNSYRYNGDSHIVSKCGKELENVFNDLIVSNGLTRYLQQVQKNEEEQDRIPHYRQRSDDPVHEE